MNSFKILFLFLVMIISPLSYSCGETRDGRRIIPTYPVIGIDKAEFNKALGEILPIIGNKNILNVSVHNSVCININTGIVSGPKHGTGTLYTIEKIENKWVVTNESNWIS
ncbi:MAG: hypothetical protein JKY50_04490 [Oleispira sp.]|nr:hypothetical protein [Oleispira sp.]MBL4882566.1 hypothetical protein [Oleispira sp.]